MAPPSSGLLVGALVLLVLLALAAAAFLAVTADSNELLRVQRRLAWLRLPELARQHWGTLSGEARSRWLREGAAAWEAGGSRLCRPGSTFETLAISLAFEAFRAPPAPFDPFAPAFAPAFGPGGGLDAAELDAVYAAFGAVAGPGPEPPLDAAAPAARLARAAAGEALPAAPGLAGAVVAAAVRHTDDPENSHDSLLLAGLSAVLARLRAEQAGAPLPDLGEVAAALPAAGEDEAPPPPPGALTLAAAALGGLEPSLPVAGLQGASDAECFQRAWLRASAPPLAAGGGRLLRRALFDALCSCWEDGALVCRNGRAARFLSAFAGVDPDPALWAGTRLEDLRNEVFADVGALIRSRAAAAAAAADPGRRLAGLAFLASSAAEAAASPPPPPEAAEALAAELREAVASLVDSRCAAFAGGAGRAPELCALLRRQALAAV